jgi:hypothetical protein
MADYMKGHGTDLVPTCDRCGKRPETGIVTDARTKEMTSVCFDCLTDAEGARLLRGERPFEEEDD